MNFVVELAVDGLSVAMVAVLFVVLSCFDVDVFTSFADERVVVGGSEPVFRNNDAAGNMDKF